MWSYINWLYDRVIIKGFIAMSRIYHPHSIYDKWCSISKLPLSSKTEVTPQSRHINLTLYSRESAKQPFRIHTLFDQIAAENNLEKISWKSWGKPSPGQLIDVVCASFTLLKPPVERCSHAHRGFASISTQQGHFSLSKHHCHCFTGGR